MIFDLNTKGQERLDAEARANPLKADQVEPTAFTGTFKGITSGVMKGGVRAAQFLGLAGSTVPALLDRVAPETDGDSRLDRYFKTFDDITKNPVDYWTPAATEVGMVGRFMGGLGEIVIPFLAGGKSAIPTITAIAGSQTTGVGLDLTKAGVDAKTTGFVSSVQGLSAAAGFAIPFFGNTLASRMTSGVAGNLATNMGGAALQSRALNVAGRPDVAAQFNPLDLEARAVDILTGLAFGGLAHVTAPRAQRRLNANEVDAVFSAANAKHFQQDTALGVPIDAASSVRHQNAIETAIQQLVRGERVSVADTITDATFLRQQPRTPVSQAVLDAYNPVPEVTAQVLPPSGPKPPASGRAADAQALAATAGRLGIRPDDLAAIIHYETSGTMSPGVRGGAGNRHIGLIQFGIEEQRRYGANQKQSFSEQLQAVERYLKDRGARPGDGISELYRIINGGNRNVSLAASDGNATIAQHIERITKRRDTDPNVRDWISEFSQVAEVPRETQGQPAIRSAAIEPQRVDVITESGNRVTARFELAEADSLPIPPRQAPDAAARVPEQTSSVVRLGVIGELRPELLGESPRAAEGAPLLRADGQIEAGNARVSAIRAAYDAGTADAYRGFLTENAQRFGIDPARISEMQRPVLVRRAEADSARPAPATQQPNPLAPPEQGQRAAQPAPEPATVEQATARQIADQTPDLRVTLDDGTELSAREAVALLDDDAARAQVDGQAFMAAVTCFLRAGA